jgi:hypothetical protein
MIQTKSGPNLTLKCYWITGYEIKHISQTVYQFKLKSYMEILDTWNYILVNFQIK